MFESLMSMTALPNLHPAFIHFPVALLMTALALDATLVVFRRWAWLDKASTLLYVLGAVGAVSAYLTGRTAANGVRGLTGVADAAMWEHAEWALVTTIVFAVIAAVRVAVERRDARRGSVSVGPLRIAVLAVSTAGQALIFETADRGGALVFKHGVSVTREGRPAAAEYVTRP